MTREEAIKVLNCLATDTTGELASKQGEYAEFLVRVIDALDTAIAALREQDATDTNVGCKWVSVDERLPEKKGQYLVYTTWTYGSFIRLCNWTPKYNGFEEHLKGRAIWYSYDSEYGDYECRDITHWMTMPEPPKEDA